MRMQKPVVFPLLFLLLLNASGWSQEILYVHPPEFADVEGDGVSGTSSQAGRFQSISLAEGFAGLPATHRVITGIRWRPDQGVSSPTSVNWTNFELRLSTTTVAPGDISMVFADNTGSDETLIYSGPATFSTQNLGPAEGPKEFDVKLDFQTPFDYDPAAGNLLVDMLWTTPFNLIPLDSCCQTFDSPVQWISRNDGDYAADRAQTRGYGGGVQFVFVPEPSAGTSLLLGMTLLATATRLSRRQCAFVSAAV